MTRMTVTARNRLTLAKDVMRHLGVRPGDTVELDTLPGGEVILRAARPAGSISAFIGLLEGRTTKAATIDEIREAAAAGWGGGAYGVR
ncbi:MAG: AbrB/MazE/SpoVT family DNA-binding domain-containing protein [Caulobacteraceae bacterium]|nr:AbrB/MazE/SpoVT family DNA-binding domain-containing protein [Caulobacteraceae bacterium]